MSFPDWFDTIPSLNVRDRLAEMIGAADQGIIEYRYADAVRLAGHSCPTVACAWLIAVGGLRKLWPNDLPQRGGVGVAYADARADGSAGVSATVIGLLTGAQDDAGFKGLAGQHDRRLAQFGAKLPTRLRMTRLDTGDAIDLDADPSTIAGDPAMFQLMPGVLAGRASADEVRAFGQFWQDRVRRILLAGQEIVRISPVR